MQIWSRFWKWYEDKILGSIIIIAIIQFIQIPHMVWNADLYLQTGVISRLHPALDWLLYAKIFSHIIVKNTSFLRLIQIQFFSSLALILVAILRFGFFLISSPGRKYSIIGSNHLKTLDRYHQIYKYKRQKHPSCQRIPCVE